MNPVLCVRNDPHDTLGITNAALAEKRVEVVKIDAFAPHVKWPALQDIGGLIVFGGEMNVDQVEQHPYLLAERQLMRRAVDAGKPVLGICLGAQMLARALDAPVYRAPVRELGFKRIRLTESGREDRLLSAFQDGDCLFQWHEDTFELPKGAELLAVGDDVRHQAFRYGANAWGVQFHFEVDRDGVDGWLRVDEPSLERVWKRTAAEVREELRTHLAEQQNRARHAFAAFAAYVNERSTT